jgi:hypothetical protein
VPEGWYEQVHESLEECIGVTRLYADIEWYVVAPGQLRVINELYAGLWSWPNRIYLDLRYVMHSPTIKHELAHYLVPSLTDGDPRFLELLRCPDGSGS